MAQDDYYYEIQLNNKQLVFYFLAGATALVLLEGRVARIDDDVVLEINDFFEAGGFHFNAPKYFSGSRHTSPTDPTQRRPAIKGLHSVAPSATGYAAGAWAG